MTTPTTQAGTNNRVYYLGADQALLTDLTALIEPKGLELLACATPADLSAACARRRPAVLMLDLGHVAGPSGLERFLGGLLLGVKPRPGVICIASRERGEDSMEARLTALRAGAGSYVLAPVSARRLASRAVRMSGMIEAGRFRILIVEDDPAQAKYIAALLANAGMEPMVVEDPMKTLDRMRAFRPNLILLDLHLPGVTGAELAAIIRDHDAYFGIPILFLSAENDLDKQLDALNSGGDGFIVKPVRKKQLIGAVEHRIRQSRWLKERHALLGRRDSANGFLPRQFFLRNLERAVHDESNRGEGTGLLIIEIDAYQKLLGELGLTELEQLLRQVEVRLSTHMTAEECATRLDDARYALLTKRETRARLQELARKLCALIAEIKTQDAGIGITASIGIGLFLPPADDAIIMISRGHKAVVGARQAGGNQIRVWTPTVTSFAGPESDAVVKRLVTTALAQDGLLLLFQPVAPLDPARGEVFEAQLRLRTLDGEQIPPADFLHIAERGGLMPSVDRWVLGRALAILDARRANQPSLRLVVHQTVATLAAPDWLPWFRDQVVQRNLLERYPLLQFQMRDIQQNIVTAKPILERLHGYGIQSAVSNVSGSTEELALLGRLGVALAKLSFQTISVMERGILVEIIQRLQEQGIAVIAAGIEDSEALARVLRCRPDFIQGNYLQMPSNELHFDFQHAFDDS